MSQLLLDADSLVSQAGFCTQALEHSIIGHEVAVAGRDSHGKRAWKATKEGWTLAEQEQSMVEEAHQTLTRELDNLFARNRELQELEVAY